MVRGGRPRAGRGALFLDVRAHRREPHPFARHQAKLSSTQHGSHLAALNATYSRYLPLVAAARARITPKHEKEDIGTLAVFYKTAGELCMLAQDYAQGEELLHEALRMFNNVPNFDCSGLIQVAAPPWPLLLAAKAAHHPWQGSLLGRAW
jgi:hypothetical protein